MNPGSQEHSPLALSQVPWPEHTCRECVDGQLFMLYEMLKPDMLYASSLKKCSRTDPECATTSGTRRIEKFCLYISPLRTGNERNQTAEPPRRPGRLT